MPSRLRRRGVVVPAALALIVGSAAAAVASTGSGQAGYRTATATVGNVDQLLSATGTTAVVHQAKAHFRTSGTVQAVKVSVGDPVQAGQVLATLDLTGLSDAVTQATATLARARATLETDQQPRTSSTTIATSAPRTSSSPAGQAPAPAGAGSSAVRAAAARRTVAAAQRTADQAMRAAAAGLGAAGTVCSTWAASPPSPPPPSPLPSPSPSPTASPTPASARGPVGVARQASMLSTAACSHALSEALGLQQKAATTQQALSSALQSVATAISAATTAGTAAPTGKLPTASAATVTRASTSATSAGQGIGSRSAASRITTDTAEIVAAQSALNIAEAGLAGATLTSPIAGTVASLPYLAGSVQSPSDTVIILGPGPVTVTVNVPSNAIRSVKVGQRASVRTDGATGAAAATVTAIALLPLTPTATGITSYPVTVLVPRPGPAFVAGGPALVSIVVRSDTGVVTVPNSALANGFVTVLAGGKAVRTRVRMGPTGELVTEITSGLHTGQRVVLADLSQALPASSATITRRFGGAGTGFGGTRAGGFAGSRGG